MEFLRTRELYTNASLTVPCHFQDSSTLGVAAGKLTSLPKLLCDVEEPDTTERDPEHDFPWSDIDTNKNSWTVEHLNWTSTWKEFDDHFVEIVPSSNPESRSSFFDEDGFVDSLVDVYCVEEFRVEPLEDIMEEEKWKLDEPIRASSATQPGKETNAAVGLLTHFNKASFLPVENPLLTNAGQIISETHVFGNEDQELDVAALFQNGNTGEDLHGGKIACEEMFSREQDPNDIQQANGEELLTPVCQLSPPQSPEKPAVQKAKAALGQLSSPVFPTNSEEKDARLSGVCKVFQEECPVSNPGLEVLQLSPAVWPEVTNFVTLSEAANEHKKHSLENLRLESPLGYPESKSPQHMVDVYKAKAVMQTEWLPHILSSDSPFLSAAEKTKLKNNVQQKEHGFDDIQSLRFQEPDIAPEKDVTHEMNPVTKALKIVASQNTGSSLGQLELNLPWSVSSTKSLLSVCAPEPLVSKYEVELTFLASNSPLVFTEKFENDYQESPAIENKFQQSGCNNAKMNDYCGSEWNFSECHTYMLKSEQPSSKSKINPHVHAVTGTVNMTGSYMHGGVKSQSKVSRCGHQKVLPRSEILSTPMVLSDKTLENDSMNVQPCKSMDTPHTDPTMSHFPTIKTAFAIRTVPSKTLDILDTPLVTRDATAALLCATDSKHQQTGPRHSSSGGQLSQANDQQCVDGFDLRFEEDDIADLGSSQEISEMQFSGATLADEECIVLSRPENDTARDVAPSHQSSLRSENPSRDHLHADAKTSVANTKVSFLDPLDNFLMLREVTVTKKLTESAVKGHTVVKPVPETNAKSVQHAGIITPMSAVPRSMKDLQETPAEQNLLTVTLSGEFSKAFQKITSQAEHQLQQLKKERLLSANVTLTSLKPGVTRFMLRDQATKLSVIDKDNTTDDVYQALLLLHTLCSAADLLQSCCLESAIVYLGEVQDKHSWLSGQLEGLRKELFKIQFKTLQSREIHPKVAAVCREIHQHSKKQGKRCEFGDNRLCGLVVVRCEQPTLMKTLQAAIAVDGTRTKIVTGQEDLEKWPEEHECLITWNQTILNKLVDKAHLVVEFEADRNSSLLQSCTQFSVNYVGLCVSSQPADQFGQDVSIRCEHLGKGGTLNDQQMTIVGSQTLIQHHNLLHLLETRHNIVVVARDYKSVGSVHHADVLVDAEMGVVLLDVEQLQETGALERVTERMASLGLHLSLVWILLHELSSKSRGDIFKTDFIKKAVHLQALMANLSTASDGFDVTYKVIFCKNYGEVAAYIHHLVDERSDRNNTLERILSHEISKEENFLLGIPCLNSISAQLLLSKASVGQLMVMSQEDLHLLVPTLSESVIKNLHQVLTMDTGLRLLLDTSSVSDNSSHSHRENSTFAAHFSLSSDDSQVISPQLCWQGEPHGKHQDGYGKSVVEERSLSYNQCSELDRVTNVYRIQGRTASPHQSSYMYPPEKQSCFYRQQNLNDPRLSHLRTEGYCNQRPNDWKQEQSSGSIQATQETSFQFQPRKVLMNPDTSQKHAYQYSVSLNNFYETGKSQSYNPHSTSVIKPIDFHDVEQELFTQQNDKREIFHHGRHANLQQMQDEENYLAQPRARPHSADHYLGQGNISSNNQLYDIGTITTSAAGIQDAFFHGRDFSAPHADSERSDARRSDRSDTRLFNISGKTTFREREVDTQMFPFFQRRQQKMEEDTSDSIFYQKKHDDVASDRFDTGTLQMGWAGYHQTRPQLKLHHPHQISPTAKFQHYQKDSSTFFDVHHQQNRSPQQEREIHSSLSGYVPQSQVILQEGSNSYLRQSQLDYDLGNPQTHCKHQDFSHKENWISHQPDYPGKRHKRSMHGENTEDSTARKTQTVDWSKGIYGHFSDQLAATTRRLLQGQTSGFTSYHGSRHRALNCISIGLAQPLRRDTKNDSQKPQCVSQEPPLVQTSCELLHDSPPLDTEWDCGTQDKGHISVAKLRKWSQQLQHGSSERVKELEYPSCEKKRALESKEERCLTYKPVSGAGGQTKLIFS